MQAASLWRLEEEDTLRRRALAEGIDMTDDGDCQCQWNTYLLAGVRWNALFCRSWLRVNGNLKKAHIGISQLRGQNSNPTWTGKVRGEKESPRSIQVLMLLIQHGENGLNLLEAQHVVLIEPLLNPAAEAQAISRVH
ncbi:uncharacterized protein [Euphorbia lathyris]|uniref:uncharacterized protein isoform X3 n=1 Tax=Euphorbia lathyris TaxID=212925 RepID=UPI0033131CA5